MNNIWIESYKDNKIDSEKFVHAMIANIKDRT